jgi:pilus assembly protein CpaF
MPPQAGAFLKACVDSKLDVVISGGSGTGKTTTLNVLANLFREDERVIVIEDSSELKLSLGHVIYLQTRPESVEGKGRITIRDLLRNALRMRPDRIIIGECRGAETFDLITAMNTGHEGCLSTVHANSTRDCLSRLTAMALMAQESVPLNVLEAWIGSAVDVIVQQARVEGGARRMVEISLVGASNGKVQTVRVYDAENGQSGTELPDFFTGKVRREVKDRLKHALEALNRGDAS